MSFFDKFKKEIKENEQIDSLLTQLLLIIITAVVTALIKGK